LDLGTEFKMKIRGARDQQSIMGEMNKPELVRLLDVAQSQAQARVVGSSLAGSDQTKPRMLYLVDPQPYGSELSVDVNC
jgi:hypothetical protein